MKNITFLLLLYVTLANAQFNQGFEGTSPLTGWSIINQGASNTFYVNSNGVSAYTGASFLRALSGSGVQNDMIITPLINVTAGVNDRISFWYKTSAACLTVKVSTVGNSSLVNFASIQSPLAATSEYTKVTLMLSNYIGMNIHVGIHLQKEFGSSVYIDDFINDGGPTCSLTVPIVDSIGPADCSSIDFPVTVNLSGLPSEDWTLYYTGNFPGSITGSGPTASVVFSTSGYYVPAISFSAGTSNGCLSPSTTPITLELGLSYEPGYAPTTGIMVDSNANGVLNAGDIIYYTTLLTSTGGCPLTDLLVNGNEGNPNNPNLIFENGSSTYIISSIPSNSTYALQYHYIITQQDIDSGSVTNQSSAGLYFTGGVAIISFFCTTDLSGALTNDTQTINNLKYYPNPVKDQLMISNVYVIEKLEVVNITGQLVIAQDIHNSDAEIDCSKLAPGLYFVKLFSNGTSQEFKIIKQ